MAQFGPVFFLIIVVALLFSAHQDPARVSTWSDPHARPVQRRTKGPGLIILVPVVQRIMRVDLRVNVMDVPPQDVISRDNVSVRVNAVVYFRVVDLGQGDAAGRGSLPGYQPVGADAAAFCAGPART